MGDVVMFRTRRALVSEPPRLPGAAFPKKFAAAGELEQILIEINGLEAVVLIALERLHHYRDLLCWTRAFCARCTEATELHDIEEMVRVRDQLQTDLIEIERLWSTP